MDLTSSYTRPVKSKITLSFIYMIGAMGLVFSQTPQETAQAIRDSIQTEFAENYSNCSSYSKNGITNFNGKPEFWSICELQNENRIIKIVSHSESTYFEEIYFEREQKLIYARETQKYTPINSFEQMRWNCEYYINKNEVISTMSLGHGKTEDEEWDENSIIEMYTKRIQEIEKIQQ